MSCSPRPEEKPREGSPRMDDSPRDGSLPRAVGWLRVGSAGRDGIGEKCCHPFPVLPPLLRAMVDVPELPGRGTDPQFEPPRDSVPRSEPKLRSEPVFRSTPFLSAPEFWLKRSPVLDLM